ncbi:hypothetical protein GCM10009813_08200 [Brevibacterium marinum]
MTEVGVDVFGIADVDRLPHCRIGLEGQTLAHGSRLGEDTVEFWSSRGSGPDFDAEVAAGVMLVTSVRSDDLRPPPSVIPSR